MTVHDNPNLHHHDDVQQVQHDTNSDEDNSDHFQGGRHKYFKTGIGPGGLVDHNSHPNCELNGFHYHTRYKVASIILLQSRHPQVGERSIEHAAPEKCDAHHGIGDYLTMQEGRHSAQSPGEGWGKGVQWWGKSPSLWASIQKGKILVGMKRKFQSMIDEHSLLWDQLLAKICSVF